ncbi:MAG: multiheme c-type cytochrome [Saprospiraceae bacterium]|nr:multiheme c-type cytochrome [Saprospiraceae bacterium]
MKTPRRVPQTTVTALLVLGACLLLAMSPLRNRNHDRFYSAEALHAYLANSPFLPTLEDVSYFADDSVCGGCHGFDPIAFSMVDDDGRDVNVYDDWRTSMMANSAKDPFWRAKVSQEIAVNPGHSLELQTKCTSCHAPQGHFTAMAQGATHYTIAEMLADSVALDGVSCGACHSTSLQHLGNRFSGEMYFDTNRVIYGPYTEPFAAPMTDFVGFEPVYSPHIHDAGICASCHTLITASVDLDGNPTGTEFIEQATYHEWLNSDFADDGLTPVTCQGCHMPQLADSIVISSQYLFLKGRSPYGLHDLVGGNTMMLQLMKNNKEALGIRAPDSLFDETIAKTFDMLRQQTLDLSLDFTGQDGDTAYFDVALFNKSGHKFPSGYPSRRAFIELWATTETGDTLFHSGSLGTDFEITGQDDAIEPHHRTIRSQDAVQIYEMVPADVNGAFTTILERAFMTLKDNRLPPRGFTTGHPTYDTTRIYGAALNDPDFNHNGSEGSGSDVVGYHIPVHDYEGMLQVTARVHYQSLPPKWMAPLFAMSTPEIETFRSMYDQADLSTVIIAEQRLDSIAISPPTSVQAHLRPEVLSVYPNPVRDGVLYIANPTGAPVSRIRIHDASGRLTNTFQGFQPAVRLPDDPQLYFVIIETEDGTVAHRVVRLPQQ